MKEISDQELVARVVATKNTVAFETLVKRHQLLIRNWLRQLSSDYSNADDIAQETFIQAWKKIHTFRGEGEFKSWLIKIAYTNFLQSKRKEKSTGNLLNEIEAYGTKNESYCINQELPDLHKLLSILSLHEKACMVLCYSHGYSHDEISNIIKLPLGTVKSHIRRSIIKIQTAFNIEG
ncbi:RNA polymerase sigma factor [Gammaproteobacteria bacterium]|nr:RNA polymerase sigma factor [Gammaproteobacteria bacterium]